MLYSFAPQTVLNFGQLVVDFANAKTTALACRAYFGNLPECGALPPDFAARAALAFPLQPPSNDDFNKTERRLFCRLGQVRSLKRKLNRKLRKNAYELDAYHPFEKTFFLYKLNRDCGGFFLGDLRMCTLREGPLAFRIDEFDTAFNGEPSPATIRQLEKLAVAGNDLERLRALVPQSRRDVVAARRKQHEKIKRLHGVIKKQQRSYRQILNAATSGRDLRKLRALRTFVKRYNRNPAYRLDINRGHLAARSPLTASRYLNVRRTGEWFGLLYHDLIYCLVTYFRSPESTRFLHKCSRCNQYFVAQQAPIDRCPRAACRRPTLIRHKIVPDPPPSRAPAHPVKPQPDTGRIVIV